MLNKLLITGAAGGIGLQLEGKLGHIAKSIRLSDIVEPKSIPEGAEFIAADLADPEAVNRIVEGCDGILHLGGISVENTFDRILQSNIIGVHNLYDAAQAHGQPRIFFASSNHAIGFYRQDEKLDCTTAHKPDSWYGVSKSFGEATALMYFNKYGQESALVRIGSCFPEPKDQRMMATWLSLDDFISLVEKVFTAPRLACPVIYGASDNDASWWDNSGVNYLGWRPKDNSAVFAEKISKTVPMPGKDEPVSVYQGGTFTAAPIMKD